LCDDLLCKIEHTPHTVVWLQVNLVNPTDAEFDVLLEQLRERLNENHAECIFKIVTRLPTKSNY